VSSLPLVRTLLLLLLLPTAALARNDAVPLTPVTLQLKWYHQFQFAGYYAARSQGFYRDAGLDVTIREGSPERNPIDDVVTGRADFGIGASELLLARGNGKPVVVLAAVIQHSPLILLALQGPEMNSFHDLVGKKIEFVPHEYELFAFFQAMGYTRDDFKLIPRAGNINALLDGDVAAISGYSTDEPYELEKRGIPYIAISPRSAGIDFYGDSLFTSEEMLQNSPQTVAAFRRASLKGWHYALNHPEEIATLIKTHYHSTISHDHLLYEARTLRSLIMPDLVELGYMNPGRWAHIASSYQQLGLLTSEVDLDTFLYTGEDKEDLTLFYWSGALAALLLLLVGSVAIYILRLNHRLRNSEERYRVLYDSAPMAILAWDDRRHITAWNRQAERMFGWSAEEVMGRDFFDFMIPVEEAEHVETLLGSIHNNGNNMGSLNWNLTKSGEKILCEWMNSVLQDKSGHVAEVIALAIDVTEKNRIQESLREKERRYRLLAENAFDVIWTMDMRGCFTYVSPSVERLRGFSVEEVMQQGLEEVLAPDSYRPAIEALHHLQSTGELLQHHWEMEQTRKDGGTIWTDTIINVIRDENNAPVEVVGITRDATERRKLEHKLQTMAHYDALTDLPNRTLFFDRLQQATRLAGRNDHMVGLLFIDLDGFKNANDQYGHEYGDRLLQEVARRLQQQVRKSDTVARMGGDEFTVILQQVNGRGDCERVAGEILESINAPYTIDGKESRLGASIGISLYPEDSTDADALLNMADKAMYRVKHDGKGDFRFFSA